MLRGRGDADGFIALGGAAENQNSLPANSELICHFGEVLRRPVLAGAERPAGVQTNDVAESFEAGLAPESLGREFVNGKREEFNSPARVGHAELLHDAIVIVEGRCGFPPAMMVASGIKT